MADAGAVPVEDELIVEAPLLFADDEGATDALDLRDALELEDAATTIAMILLAPEPIDETTM